MIRINLIIRSFQIYYIESTLVDIKVSQYLKDILFCVFYHSFY